MFYNFQRIEALLFFSFKNLLVRRGYNIVFQKNILLKSIILNIVNLLKTIQQKKSSSLKPGSGSCGNTSVELQIHFYPILDNKFWSAPKTSLFHLLGLCVLLFIQITVFDPKAKWSHSKPLDGSRLGKPSHLI